MNKFYYVYDDEEDSYCICQYDGGYELGAYYDTAEFWCSAEEDALAAVMLLNSLYEQIEKKEK